MDSRDVATAAVRVAVTGNFEEESAVKAEMHDRGIAAAAVNFGGDFISSINKIIERAVVAAKREGLIDAEKGEEGAVAGAAREAVSQLMTKAVGLNVGGKIGIARADHHVSVAVYFSIGMLNLNEVAIGLGHRVV
ncbi:MAG: HutP family protein [Eubacteriales bacterium]|nr:HutP family protein [Eubacteriales bacterium]